jgi:hypothetical protein
MSSKNTRQVRNVQIDTVAVVRQALDAVAGQTLDLAAAEAKLRGYGHKNPQQAQIEQLAYQVAVLAELQKLTGANCSAQVGKWNFSNEQTIHAAFNSYLNRRVAGQRARWNS